MLNNFTRHLIARRSQGLVRQTQLGFFSLNNDAVMLRQPVTKQVLIQSQLGQMQRRYFSNTKLNDNELIEHVEGKVFEVLKSAAKCNHEKLSRTASFEELGFESLDGVELVLAMEEHFGFDVTNNEAEKITTVMDAIQTFHAHELKR